MLTGEYEHDKAELERLIAHEEKMADVAERSRQRYAKLLRELNADEANVQALLRRNRAGKQK